VRLRCGDDGDAAWLMESAVERISRYLDRKTVPLFSTDVRWLLLTAFCRLLRRYSKKVERIKLVGDMSALPEPAVDDGWAERANSHADLTKILRRLGPRSCTIFSLRLAGFTWREIADALKLNEVAVKRTFWREIRRVQDNLPRKPEPEKPRLGPELR
jgi:DNA-directed RNA polymerase specialized sigma24 family protein